MRTTRLLVLGFRIFASARAGTWNFLHPAPKGWEARWDGTAWTVDEHGWHVAA